MTGGLVGSESKSRIKSRIRLLIAMMIFDDLFAEILTICGHGGVPCAWVPRDATCFLFADDDLVTKLMINDIIGVITW